MNSTFINNFNFGFETLSRISSFSEPVTFYCISTAFYIFAALNSKIRIERGFFILFFFGPYIHWFRPGFFISISLVSQYESSCENIIRKNYLFPLILLSLYKKALNIPQLVLLLYGIQQHSYFLIFLIDYCHYQAFVFLVIFNPIYIISVDFYINRFYGFYKGKEI